MKVALKKEPIYIGIEEKSKVMQRFSILMLIFYFFERRNHFLVRHLPNI